MNKLTIALDIDGTIAEIHGPWLDMYNREHNDSLAMKHITDWDMTKFTKCGFPKLESYIIQPHFYEQVSPIEGALDAVERLRTAGHTIVYASSCLRTQFDQKMAWLERYGFTANAQKDTIAIYHKQLLDVDVLVDDRLSNVLLFNNSTKHKSGIVFDSPWNQTTEFDPQILRMFNWKQIDRLLSFVYDKKTISLGGYKHD